MGGPWGKIRPMPTFIWGGHRLAYTEFGDGGRHVVLVHGLLLSQKLVAPLAAELARRGNHVVTLDVLGHGRSDRPGDLQAYSMTDFGAQVLGLMDHLGMEEAVVGGVSLGANTALEAAVAAPSRVRGLVVSMPVLDNALLACALAFTPLLAGLTLGAPVMRAVGRVARAVPTRGVWAADVALDTVRQDPTPSAAVLQGLFFHRVAPRRAERRTIAAPALVIGHPRDPVHPFTDADELVADLPDGRLVRSSSIAELFLTPDRLTGEIAAFLDEVWDGRRRRRPRRVA